ncbi:MAG: hypothetical protein M1296_02320 [Chloroflexi bacterium]|nr:hypothetical protein [Chloroflexota bacterium]
MKSQRTPRLPSPATSPWRLWHDHLTRDAKLILIAGGLRNLATGFLVVMLAGGALGTVAFSLYDLAIFSLFRHIHPPEEQAR